MASFCPHTPQSSAALQQPPRVSPYSRCWWITPGSSSVTFCWSHSPVGKAASAFGGLSRFSLQNFPSIACCCHLGQRWHQKRVRRRSLAQVCVGFKPLGCSGGSLRSAERHMKKQLISALNELCFSPFLLLFLRYCSILRIGWFPEEHKDTALTEKLLRKFRASEIRGWEKKPFCRLN